MSAQQVTEMNICPDLLYSRIKGPGWRPEDAADRARYQHAKNRRVEKQFGKPAPLVAAEMQAYGATLRQISKDLGVSVSTASKWARQGSSSAPKATPESFR